MVSRYLTLYNRKVRFPDDSAHQGKEFEYDIIGHPSCLFHFTVCFPFHPARGEQPAKVTIIREYSQGPNCMLYNLPCGGFDPKKHSSFEDCAAQELSEEAGLKGGAMHKLIPAEHPGMCEVKWCANRFTPFLCIGPAIDACPGKQDDEELIQVRQVSLKELRVIMHSGDMLLPAITTSFMALDYLDKLGFDVGADAR